MRLIEAVTDYFTDYSIDYSLLISPYALIFLVDNIISKDSPESFEDKQIESIQNINEIEELYSNVLKSMSDIPKYDKNKESLFKDNSNDKK